MTKFRRLVEIVLIAGLVVLTACTSKSNYASVEEEISSRCSQKASACNVLAGSSTNSVASGIDGATIAGGGLVGSPNRVNGDNGTVGGGEGNTAGEGSTVAGGSGNTALYFHATVGGGANNFAVAHEATVGGGLKNTASGRFATVGGGATNLADSFYATVSGGSGNTASFNFATVGGGTLNQASSEASVVSGGNYNLAQGAYSAISGGINNTAGGNTAAIGGGAGNMAGGMYAVIPGGFANQAAGDYCFAAGRKAIVNADHPGVCLFADSKNFNFSSFAPNEFAVRATGGVRFITAIDSSGNSLSGVRLSPGSGSWDSLSDATAKDGFASVEGYQILEQLDSIPISTWYYRGEDPSIRHIGPTAQDFYAAFHLGQDGHYISTVDEEGIALAAIQELYQLIRQDQTQCRIAPLSGDSILRGQVASLRSQLTISNWLAATALLTAILALWRSKKKTA